MEEGWERSPLLQSSQDVHSLRPRTPSGSAKKHVFTDPNFSPISEPSPGRQKFTSISSNARNDLYLRTLINSPYNKAQESVTGTPAPQSPFFKTPIRGKGSPGVASTPVGTRLPGNVSSTPKGTCPPPCGENNYVTPKSQIINPFDTGSYDELHLPTFMSPGVFTVLSTPASDEKKAFRWSIEHLALLNPAEIDEHPVQQEAHLVPDKETEERAQRAIDQFFASNLIVPSPWSNERKKVTGTPAQTGAGSHPELLTELQGSIQKQLPQKAGTQEASCQTVLTLPVSFDLQKLLGAYMTHEPNEEANQDMLSTSSLRRKLFFHGDSSSLAPSPVKGMNFDEVQLEASGSPVFVKEGTPGWEQITPHKDVHAFASSPIKSCQTPQHRRCSSDPDFLASPELSPIVHGNVPGRIRKSRSSGIFNAHDGSFEASPVCPVDDPARNNSMSSAPMSPVAKNYTMSSPPVSPIASGATPQEKRMSMAQSLPGSPGFSPIAPSRVFTPARDGEELCPALPGSPGFSPIRPLRTPLRKSRIGQSQDESSLDNTDHTGSTPQASSDGSESITPVSTHPNSLKKSPLFVNRSWSAHSYHETEDTAMDFETAPHPKSIRFADNIRTSSICEGIRTSSMCETADFSDMDFPEETSVPLPSLSNQDTGYQTASLQSTNHDTGLHTNLTSQFNSLPFNMTNPEVQYMCSGQVKPCFEAPVSNLTQHFTSLADTERTRSDTDIYCKLVGSKNVIEQNSNNSNDSALPDESRNFNAVRLKPSGVSNVGADHHRDPNLSKTEESILQRARQVLAMANTMYPKNSGETGNFDLDVTAEMVSELEPLIASTPHKDLRRILPAEDDYKMAPVSASEMALSILRQAGADLAKYGPMIPSDTEKMGVEGQS